MPPSGWVVFPGVVACHIATHEERTIRGRKPMIGSTMNLLAIIIIVLALAAAGAIIYAAWELSSDKASAGKPDDRSAARTDDANEGETGDPPGNKQATPGKNESPES